MTGSNEKRASGSNEKRASGGGEDRTRRGKSDSIPLAELAGTGQCGAGTDKSRMASGRIRRRKSRIYPEKPPRKISLARFLMPIYR